MNIINHTSKNNCLKQCLLIQALSTTQVSMFLVLACIFSMENYAQVGIGISDIHESAVLQVESTNKGLLLPRLTTSERDQISNPVEGLMIYNTSLSKFQGYAQGNVSTVVANSSVNLTDAYVYDDGDYKNYPAQSFQPSATGTLESISFSVAQFYNDFTQGTIHFDLYLGEPNSALQLLFFTTQIFINATGVIEVLIPGDISISQGSPYYFELVPAQALPNAWFSVHRSNGATPGEHEDGSLWYFSNFGGGSMESEGSYTDSSIDDLWFVVRSNVCCESGWVNLH